MTFHQHITNQVEIIDLLLRYLPECETSYERDSIMFEIRELRKEVSFFEEMTKTEKQKDVKLKTITIESDINL